MRDTGRLCVSVLKSSTQGEARSKWERWGGAGCTNQKRYPYVPARIVDVLDPQAGRIHNQNSKSFFSGVSVPDWLARLLLYSEVEVCDDAMMPPFHRGYNRGTHPVDHYDLILDLSHSHQRLCATKTEKKIPGTFFGDRFEAT